MSALREVHPRLFVGDLAHCQPGTSDRAVIHACKIPCHQRAIGYTGSLHKDHPGYLALADPHNLWLNLIDPPSPLFQLESFHAFFAFAAPRFDSGQPLLIHCNQGESRSPSLALLLLARHLHVIPYDSFSAAQAAYLRLDPAYRPGTGIARFLAEQWSSLG